LSGVKRPGREIGHATPSSVKLKMHAALPPLPVVFHNVVLV
jgi:hypothetical protein